MQKNGQLGLNDERKAELHLEQEQDRAIITVLKSRLRKLQQLERDHADLKKSFEDLSKAKQEADQQVEEWKAKFMTCDQEKTELQEKLQKADEYRETLEKSLAEEKSRFHELQTRYDELDSKLVEIVNNVSHLSIDEAKQQKESRKLNNPSSKKAQKGYRFF